MRDLSSLTKGQKAVRELASATGDDRTGRTNGGLRTDGRGGKEDEGGLTV